MKQMAEMIILPDKHVPDGQLISKEGGEGGFGVSSAKQVPVSYSGDELRNLFCEAVNTLYVNLQLMV